MTGNSKAPPSGKLTSVVTFLEMRRRPESLDLHPPRDDLSVMQAIRPTASFYRYLYNTVGGPWLWWERRRLSDEQLCEIIDSSSVEIYVLYAMGVPAGYVELDRRVPPDIEIAYFGIMPEFIGQGLGPYLLRWAIAKSWSYESQRLWLHTCTLDHPKALAIYQNAGFEIYDRKVVVIDDPRTLGYI